MGRFLKISLFLLLVALSQNSHAKDTLQKVLIKNTLKALGKISSFIGPAMELIEMGQTVVRMFIPGDGSDDPEERYNELTREMRHISSEVKEFEERLVVKMDTQAVSDELQHLLKIFYKRIKEIDQYYEFFVDYFNGTLQFRDDEIMKFAVETTKPAKGGINHILQRAHDALVTSEGISKNIPTLLNDPRIIQDFMCAMGQSPQQIIHTLYQTLMMAEVKGFAMLTFSNEILNAVNREKTTYKQVAINRFNNRKSYTFEIVRNAMITASRESYRCDPNYPLLDTNYARIGPVFQKYAMLESDAHYVGTHDSYGCTGTCDDIEHAWHKCKDGGCDPQHCHGKVRNCERKGSSLSYCLANDAYRRYQYLLVDDKEFGMNRTCDFEQTNTHGEYITGFVRCTYCMCTCEDTVQTMDKYVSLQPVMSDFEDNKVITGVRLTVVKNVFHIQIKQGVLLPKGQIDSTTEEWKEVDNFDVTNKTVQKDVDYYEITWDTRTVCFDDLDSTPNSLDEEQRVLTGVQFEKFGDRIQLITYLSQFDYESGQLLNDENNPQEYYNDSEADRLLLSMDELDIPIRYKNNRPRSSPEECLEITTSDMNKDAGQNVLPFIDIQSVTTYPSLPLSGVGLHLRADDKQESGGYLALKLFTLNFVPYMDKSRNTLYRK